MGIDTHFYPLGSCTMKFNPRINEVCAKLKGFTKAHPLAADSAVQGCLQIICELIERLCALTGMTGGTLLPNAGSQGEFVGVTMMKAYHRARGDVMLCEMLVPDSAHGTNPATVAMAGLITRSIPSTASGDIDLAALKQAASEKTVGLMLTNPNTLGLFSPNILQIAQ
jgi:glycine dehydrogenase subunit 2